MLLAFSALILSLAWANLSLWRMDRIISVVFVLIGFLVVFLNPIQFALGISFLPTWFLKLTPSSFLIRAGAFVLTVGIAGLIKSMAQHSR